MADLIAQGADLQHRWRRQLPVDAEVVVGRRAPTGWSTPWDDHISREHFSLRWNGSSLAVERLAAAANPVFVGGKQLSRFEIKPGEHFVVGSTTFTLSGDQVLVTFDAPRPNREETFSSAELGRIAYRNAQERLALLGQLPDLIHSATSDSELFVRLVNLLLTGIPQADTAALVQIDPASPTAAAKILHWDRRRIVGGDFQPSQRLIQSAVSQQQTVLHTWTGSAAQHEFTSAECIDWAFCTPLRTQACSGWALYLAGRFNIGTPGSAGQSEPADLRDDIKFTELAAATLGSLRELRRLDRQQAGLSQFFSPIVLQALAADGPERALAPKEADVSVLFCDLRGFARTTERSAGDLFGLLNRVSQALGVMTNQILEHAGVIGDFHGDAAMGFWGWPIATSEGPARAGRAALGIRSCFEAAAGVAGHPLAKFHVGLGLATGRAVAGKIGTADHVKVTVYGPVVNLAARLESLTRSFHAPILLDRDTAEAIRRDIPTEQARVRRVATVRPYGLETPVEVSELLPPESADPSLRDEHLQTYESALDAFQAGDWNRALELLHQVPPTDRVKDFLTVFIAKHGRVPPTNWDGSIALQDK